MNKVGEAIKALYDLIASVRAHAHQKGYEKGYREGYEEGLQEGAKQYTLGFNDAKEVYNLTNGKK